jgi:hypothetical protein
MNTNGHEYGNVIKMGEQFAWRERTRIDPFYSTDKVGAAKKQPKINLGEMRMEAWLREGPFGSRAGCFMKQPEINLGM